MKSIKEKVESWELKPESEANLLTYLQKEGCKIDGPPDEIFWSLENSDLATIQDKIDRGAAMYLAGRACRSDAY